jgi:endo-1,4-beta-xylanase
MRRFVKGIIFCFTMLLVLLLSASRDFAEGTEKTKKDSSDAMELFENFEGSTHIAIARSADISIVEGAGVDGSKALLVSKRTQNWNGVNFDGNAYAGGSIDVSAQVKSQSKEMYLTVQYDKDGSTSYNRIASGTTGKDDYVLVSGSYEVPGDVTNIIIYLEANDLSDFYIDNFKIIGIAKPEHSIQEELTPLKEHLAKEATIAGKAGVAIPVSALDDKVRMALVTKHFNSVTPENEMKPDSFLGAKPTFNENGQLVLNFTNADKIMDYVLAYNKEHPEDIIRVKGHVLVWHSQTPEWFFKENYASDGAYVAKEVMLERLEYYIKTVLQHYDGADSKYAGIIYAWDVVNEQIDQGGIRKSDGGSGISHWYQVFQGDDSYIKEAFRLANQYAPSHIKLIYNDYGETDRIKYEAISKLLQEIKEYPGARIDGMGMQGHYSMESPAMDSFEKAIRAYAAVVDEVQITELDLQSSLDYDGTNKEAENTKQGYRYKEIFEKLYELDKETGIDITGVTVWGTHDGASWLNNASFVGGGADGKRKQCPLLFDDEYQAKPAYYGIVDPSQLEPYIKSAVALYSASGSWAMAPKTTYRSNGTEVSFQIIWDEKDIRVKVQVADKDAAKGDEIIVYLDAANSRSEKAKIKEYTLKRTKAKDTKQGYEGIVTIPLSGRKAGDKVGLDIAVINDGAKLSWNDLKDMQDTTSKYYGEVIMKPYAQLSHGTPVIDGELDKIWKKQEELPLTIKTGNPKATAKVRAMWDEKYLYVYAEVTDKVISKASANAYEQDSLEIFVDQNNGKTTSYEEDDCQYRINYSNETSFNGTKCTPDHIRSATKRTKSGYVVEAAIQWTDITPKAGTVIGLDFQINDDAGSGSRAGTYNWYDETGTGYTNPSVLGTVTLEK